MASRKGIILAGGKGTRLAPITQSVSKQLLPVYDKPMVYYPLATLLQAGIEEVAVITAPEHGDAFRACLGDGSSFGVSISYIVGENVGVPDAYLLAEQFLAGEPSALIIADNLFAGAAFQTQFSRSVELLERSTIFAHPVNDPHNYAIISYDRRGRPQDIHDRPSVPRSNLAITGLYLLDGKAPERVRALPRFRQGTYEIRDLLLGYLNDSRLNVEHLGLNSSWFDMGNPEELLDASLFVRDSVVRSGEMLGCVEEIAFHSGRINKLQLLEQARRIGATAYGKRLRKLATDRPKASFAMASGV